MRDAASVKRDRMLAKLFMESFWQFDGPAPLLTTGGSPQFHAIDDASIGNQRTLVSSFILVSPLHRHGATRNA
jgi:hypothetical protein